jgi:hypothetical protein
MKSVDSKGACGRGRQSPLSPRPIGRHPEPRLIFFGHLGNWSAETLPPIRRPRKRHGFDSLASILAPLTTDSHHFDVVIRAILQTIYGQ